MTINAVQQHVVDLLDGMQPDFYYGEPVEARLRPLTPDFVRENRPLVFVWGAVGEESRYTPPRQTVPNVSQYGLRKLQYKLRIWVITASDNSDEVGPRAFPALLWQVMDALRTDPMPVEITDPDTGATSFLELIGEQFEWDYDVDRTLSDQRLMRSLGLITCPILEMWNE